MFTCNIVAWSGTDDLSVRTVDLLSQTFFPPVTCIKGAYEITVIKAVFVTLSCFQDKFVEGASLYKCSGTTPRLAPQTLAYRSKTTQIMLKNKGSITILFFLWMVTLIWVVVSASVNVIVHW